VHNARAVLIARVQAVSERLRAAPVRRNRLHPHQLDAATVILPHTADDKATQLPSTPPNELTVVGLFAGKISSAELLADSEFHSSVHDLTTANWRRSIARNQRLAQQRRGLWIG
jgi:hypothetical protein